MDGSNSSAAAAGGGGGGGGMSSANRLSEGLNTTVSTGDGKRSRVAIDPAATAASAGGVSSGAFGAGAAAQEHTTKQKKYGRPCLSGLPEGVIGHVGTFLTTLTAVRLSKVSKETREKAIDDTFGVFRHFAMTKKEEDIYGKIKKVEEMKHMGKIRTAFVGTDDSSCLVELLEASRATLEELTVCGGEYDMLLLSQGHIEASNSQVEFPKLTRMDVQSTEWLEYIGVRRWALPALTSLQIHGCSASTLVPLLNASPKIEQLETKARHPSKGGCISLSKDTGELVPAHDDTESEWPGFLSALQSCPYLTTITGMWLWSGESDRLKSSEMYSTHTGPTRKTMRLEFVVSPSTAGDNLGQGAAANVQAFRSWAAGVNCELKWRPVGDFYVDCSSDAAEAPRAPGGVMGDVASELAPKATGVDLRLGGTPLHSSWSGVLSFPNAKWLRISVEEGASVSAAVGSIPTCLIDETSRRLPAVQHLRIPRGHCEWSSLADLPVSCSKMRSFLGGLKTLQSTCVPCGLMSLLPVEHR